MCLPLDPQYSNYVVGTQRDAPGRATMVVAEYQGNPDEIFDFDNLNGASFLDENIPCAVCHESNHTSVIMIPGRQVTEENI